MTIRPVLLISFLLAFCGARSQSVSHVYKIGDLLKRISHPDTIYVVNFWATWCKPCIAELPAFDSLQAITKGTRTKLILVNLDFSEEIGKKVNPFLVKNKIKAECVLLDEVNGNDFVNKISPDWSGAIPATLFKSKKANDLIEKKLNFSELKASLARIKILTYPPHSTKGGVD